MPPNESEEAVRRYYDEVWNRANPAAMDDLFAPRYVDHSPGPTQERGRASVKKYIALLRATFPDLHVTVEETFSSGDRVVARLTFRGAHRGNLLGDAATGRTVTWTGIDVYRVVDGRIVEGWSERDRLRMRQQIPARGSTPGSARSLLGQIRGGVGSRWQVLVAQAGAYRALRPAARNWRERASLLRFLLARLVRGDAEQREATIRLDGATYTLGLATAEIYTLIEQYHDRLYDRAAEFIPRPGWTVVDVGANVGIVSIQQARRGARVFAFEPNAECFRRLRRNVAANRLSPYISAVNCAVGAAPGRGMLLVPRGLTTFGSVTPLADTASAPESAVDVTSLDHVMPSLDVARIDLLKIDAEGAEYDVLRGAERTLGIVDRVVVEYHSLDLLRQVEALLSDRGFTRVLRVDANPNRDAGLLFARSSRLDCPQR